MDSPIKWVGGKGRLLSTLYPLAPSGGFTRYFEPFFGGGAFFFGLDQNKLTSAFLGDANADLILFYETIGQMPVTVGNAAADLAAKHSGVNFIYARDLYNALAPFRTDYNNVRTEVRILHAALFLYINKTCFNGLFRVSRSGRFNVPPNPNAKWKPSVPELGKTLVEVSRALRSAELFPGNYTDFLTAYDPGKGDFIFCDPPYVPLESGNGFTSYTKEGFSPLDLMSLFLDLQRAGERGAKWMVTHRDTPYVRELAADFHIFEYTAPRSVAANGRKREPVQELCIRNYKNG